jgi:hypothetical protein
VVLPLILRNSQHSCLTNSVIRPVFGPGWLAATHAHTPRAPPTRYRVLKLASFLPTILRITALLPGTRSQIIHLLSGFLETGVNMQHTKVHTQGAAHCYRGALRVASFLPTIAELTASCLAHS